MTYARFDGSPDHVAPDTNIAASAHRTWRLANPDDTGRFDKILGSIDKWLTRVALGGAFADFLLRSAGLPGGKALFVVVLLLFLLSLLFGIFVAIGKHFRLVGAKACKSKPLTLDDDESYGSPLVRRPPIFRPASEFEAAGTGSSSEAKKSDGKTAPKLESAAEYGKLPSGRQLLKIKDQGVVTFWIED